MYTIYFDGGYNYHQKRTTAGFIIKKNEKIISSDSVEVEEENGSNNVAEYAALLLALQHLAAEGKTKERILVIGDSKMVIEQTFGRRKVSRGAYLDYAHACHDFMLRFTNLEGRWVSRTRNTEADALTGTGKKHKAKRLINLRSTFGEPKQKSWTASWFD